MPRRKRCIPTWREKEYGRFVRRGSDYIALYKSTGWSADLPEGAVDSEPQYPGQEAAPFMCRVVQTKPDWYMLTTRARAKGGTRHRYFTTREAAIEAGTQWVRRRYYYATPDEAHTA